MSVGTRLVELALKAWDVLDRLFPTEPDSGICKCGHTSEAHRADPDRVNSYALAGLRIPGCFEGRCGCYGYDPAPSDRSRR